MPPQDKKPFSIASCIAIWLNEGDPTPGIIGMGDFGEEDSISIDNDILEDLRPNSILKGETSLKIGLMYFPNAVFISMIAKSLILELPKESGNSWYKRLQKVPSEFNNCPPGTLIMPWPHCHDRTEAPQLRSWPLRLKIMRTMSKRRASSSQELCYKQAQLIRLQLESQTAG